MTVCLSKDEVKGIDIIETLKQNIGVKYHFPYSSNIIGRAEEYFKKMIEYQLHITIESRATIDQPNATLFLKHI